ncbi:NAD(P)-dependent oxidoreductase [Phytoactinopolyspora alkaliphila]|uniref:NAD(P)-dependent oxidoreductase n=1 Tax=Phytoactinopolyspora alkaliphila TaxID=1783498 RepID=A0A6N9YNF1_9ACTN|nr:NAD(P)-dependent oxidoreductase [Phytoactinopolyspora alkaliphila]NED96368.1 NAD(P)-dependent oxidoreductase [Phytoactinopolyspora alkaliphila]
MRVLVTGAAGRVGSWVAEELANSGHDVRGMVRPGGRSVPEPLRSRIQVMEAALTDTRAIERAVAGADVVVHLAAQIVMADTPVDTYVDINTGGTLRLLEAAVRQDPPVRRFVHASTDNTYGPVHPQAAVITEDHPQTAGDYYSTSKLLAERLVENYHRIHGLEYSILRLGSVIAPDEAEPLFRREWVRAFFAMHADAGDRSNLWQLFRQCDDPVGELDAAVPAPDGNPALAVTGPSGTPWSIHFTDVRDVVDGVVLALEHPAAANQTFNMLGPRTTTFAEGAEVMARRRGAEVLEVRMPMTLAFELSSQKAARLLGYEPRWTFDDTLSSAPAVIGAG